MAAWNLPRPAAAAALSIRLRRKAILAQVFIVALGLLLQGEADAALTLNCSNPNAESLLKALEMSVFQRKAIRPVVSLRSPTQVNVSFTLYAILGVDEKIQTMTTFIWQVLEWNMEIVEWDPVQCGTDNISIPSENIWVPDILINEFMDEDRSPKTPYLYLKHNGNVYYDMPVRVVSSCTMDIFTFPFDVQNCSLSFGSYLHTENDVRVSLGMTAEKTLQTSKALMKTKGEWELVNIEARGSFLSTIDLEYDEVVYQLIIRRRPKLRHAVFVIVSPVSLQLIIRRRPKLRHAVFVIVSPVSLQLIIRRRPKLRHAVFVIVSPVSLQLIIRRRPKLRHAVFVIVSPVSLQLIIRRRPKLRHAVFVIVSPVSLQLIIRRRPKLRHAVFVIVIVSPVSLQLIIRRRPKLRHAVFVIVSPVSLQLIIRRRPKLRHAVFVIVSPVSLQLIIRRRPKLYVMNLIVPSTFLMMIDLCSFLLPAQNVDRASFKMTLILGYTVFLLIMNDLLPSSAETPLISSYFAISLSLMVASVLETVAITNILYSSRQYPEVPHWVRKLILQCMARVVCYSPKLTHWPDTSKNTVSLNHAFQGAVHEVKDPREVDLQGKQADLQGKQAELQLQKISEDLQCIRQYLDSHFHKGENEEVWMEIGHILDRFLFGLYLFFLMVSSIVFIIIWATWQTASTD
ncbi:5-hydroxytryptamine receptor 3C-like [Polyodon spathula]|uniref:5-hydroxytryptamine receptor 3C-like n=1 Tax=Polyodon spathula TaxID=7913 RepID=UPI001B7F5DCC|nr:5-hydroxytryptamine receptor 3C-like [Polyodon spathula]